LSFFINHFESNNNLEEENSMSIKLPPLKTFGDLEEIAKKFKIALELPLADSKIFSELEIKTDETGSIWLAINLRTIEAVKLIGRITWSVSVFNKDKKDAKLFNEEALKLDMTIDKLKEFTDKRDELTKGILESEAQNVIENC
jgi:hypothetical protein